MNKNSSKWSKYFKATASSTPRNTCADAIQRFQKEERKQCVAVDLGCGSGNDTIALLKAGWYVHAIDREKAALRLLKRRVSISRRNRLTLEQGRFKDISLYGRLG